MSDIVETMRSGELCGEYRCRVMDKAGGCTCVIAADEITRLRAEIERLREALRQAQINMRSQIETAKELARVLTFVSTDIEAALPKENSDE